MSCELDAFFGLRSLFRLVVTFDRGTAEAAFTTTRRAAFTAWATETTGAAARSTTFTAWAHAAAAHGFAELRHGGDIFFFRDAAVAVGVHAFEGFLRITKHAAAWASAFATWPTTFRTSGRTAFGTRSTFWTRCTTFTTWGATEASFGAWGAARRAAFAGTTCATCVTHALRDAAKLVCINEAVAIAVSASETVVRFLAGHAGKFFLADLAVAIRVGAFHKLSDSTGSVTAAGRAAGSAWRRSFGLVAVLCGGDAHGEAENAESANE